MKMGHLNKEKASEKLLAIIPEKRSFQMLVTPCHANFYQRNAYEDFTADLMLTYSKANSLFIDIGAHYGFYSLLMGTSDKKIKVIAFEPSPKNYEILCNNFELNGLNKRNAYNLAISNEDGICNFNIATHSSHCGFYQHHLSNTVETIPIKTASINNFIKEIPEVPTIIKIDTEGHEIFVLEGMKNILENTKDIKLFIEFNPPSLKSSETQPEKLLEVLSQLGFQIYFIDDEQREIYKLSEDRIYNWESYFGEGNFKKDYFNILCVKKQKSLSVCLFSHTSNLGGAERSVLDLTTELINDHDVICTVFLPNDGLLRERLEKAGASVLIKEYYWWSNIPPEEEIKPRFSNSLKVAFEQIIPRVEKINPDIIFSNSIVNPWGAVTAFFLCKPHVWFIHEFGELDHNLKFYLPFQRILDVIKDSSNIILTCSNAVKKRLFGDSSDDTILTIYDSINIPSSDYISDDRGYHFKRTNTTKLIITGFISESKGQKDAILAVEELIRRKKDVELLIVGPSFSSYLDELKKTVQERNLEEYIIFEDFTEHIIPVVAQADIVLVCSKYEAFGRVTVESMLLKKPTIGANSGGTLELIAEGINGLLYEPGDYRQLADKIEYLIENREKIKEFGENGYRFAKEKFTRENFGGRVYKLLMDVNKKPNSSGRAFAQFINKLISDYTNLMELEIVQLQEELNKIKESNGWRFLQKCNQVKDRTFPIQTKRREAYNLMFEGLRLIMKEGWSDFLKKGKNSIKKTIKRKLIKRDPYKIWIFKNEPDRFLLKVMQTESKSLPYRKRISIITPVFNTDENELSQCVNSVLNQVYDNWELCIVDGGSDKSYVKELLKEFAEKDPRIKFVSLSENFGIAGNSNEALKLATGEYVAFLDHDDMLAPFALYEVVKYLNENPEVDFVYSDEDKVPAKDGQRYDPFFKPDWSPDTFLSYNYLCHFSVIRRTIVEKAGGFRTGYDGAQDYDMFLRVVQKTNNISRVPKILYHWRATQGSAASELLAKPYALDAAKRAIGEYLKNKGMEAEVLDGLFPTSYRVKYRISHSQRVSIIIPTRDKVDLLKKCVTSILEKTDYKDYEIVIVDNQSKEEATIEYFELLKNNPPSSPFNKGGILISQDVKIRVLPYNMPFNYSAINNFAVKSTNADYLLFLNNDTEVITPEWLSSMIEHAQRKQVGAVGAKLYYPNDTIQHAGVILGILGVANHSHLGFPRSSHGYFGRLNVIQNVSAVTGACMVVRRDVFEEVGGFDESLSHAFNDVDLCLKIREKGYFIVYTPYAELYHHESASRGYDLATPERKARFDGEIDIMKARWEHIFGQGDPYYNPNLTLSKTDFSIRLEDVAF